MDDKSRLPGDGMKRPPIYDLGKDGHFGACQNIVQQGRAPNPDIYTGPWANICQGLHGSYREILSTYWQASLRRLEDEEHDYKQHQLPLARIKKVMKADPEVKMISAEAPILFAKGCDIFITELTMRAWIHAEENKRRTLQRSDIAAALTKSDMFDFLIDIVPREEAGASNAKRPAGGAQAAPQPQPTQMPSQQNVPQPGPPTQSAAPHDYGYVSEQDYRPPPQMYPPPQGDPAAAYGYPPGSMVDQSMYGGYPMAPQQVNPARPEEHIHIHPKNKELIEKQMYHMPPQQPPPQTRDQQVDHKQQAYGATDGSVGNEVDAEGERDYEVG